MNTTTDAKPATAVAATRGGPADRRGDETHPVPLFTNHAHVLAALYEDPDIRQRDIAERIGLTEGAVQRLLHELAESGHITVERIGRRNHYQVMAGAHLRHPLERDQPVRALLEMMAWPRTTPSDTTDTRGSS